MARTYTSASLYSNTSVITSPILTAPSGIASGSITSSTRLRCSGKAARTGRLGSFDLVRS